MAHRKDLHTARRLCEVLNDLHLEDALTHVTVALQVKTARAFGVDIKGKFSGNGAVRGRVRQSGGALRSGDRSRGRGGESPQLAAPRGARSDVMTTEQEWKKDESDTLWCGDLHCFEVDEGYWLIGGAPGQENTSRVDFRPTPTEAMAAARMGWRPKPYSQPEVHAHIREHGSVEECEAITPAWSVVDPDSCPGCGSEPAGHTVTRSGCKGDPEHVWHRRCFDRVRSRTEAARSGEPEPEWRKNVRVAADDLGLSAEFGDGCRFRFWRYGSPLPATGTGWWCLGESVTLHHAKNLAETSVGLADDPAPVQPVEPRPFRVGDRVRGKNTGALARVTGFADLGMVVIEYEDDEFMGGNTSPSLLTLVTPAPEEPAPEAPRLFFQECIHCGTDDVADGYQVCGDCCDCDSDRASPCPACGGMDEDERGPVAHPPTAYVHEGATATNPIGLPTMLGYMPDERKVLAEQMAAINAKWEADVPRVGDVVSWLVATATAGPHTVTDERQGIVVPHDDNEKRAPEGYLMARTKGTDGNAWTTVAVEACTVVRKREAL